MGVAGLAVAIGAQLSDSLLLHRLIGTLRLSYGSIHVNNRAVNDEEEQWGLTCSFRVCSARSVTLSLSASASIACTIKQQSSSKHKGVILHRVIKVLT